MKTTIGLILVLVVLALVLAASVNSQTTVVVKEQITITVDSAKVVADVPPINVKGRTLVPVRGVFDAFEAEIGWFPNERRVFIRRDCDVIWLRIGDANAKVNDRIVPLAPPAMLYQRRTMVPLRFIAEALGATVDWNAGTQTITIVTRKETKVTPPST